ITDPARLRKQLAEIRRRGFAVSFEETDEGVAGVSVPIRNARHLVVAGLTISGPMTRVNAATLPQFTELALEGARRIGAELGHRPSPFVAPPTSPAALPSSRPAPSRTKRSAQRA